jgi:hypothetical protein
MSTEVTRGSSIDDAAAAQAQSIYDSFAMLTSPSNAVAKLCAMECIRRMIDCAHTSSKPYLEEVKYKIENIKTVI